MSKAGLQSPGVKRTEMEQIRPHSILRASWLPKFFVSIDFDGTVADTDITDAVIKEFASPQWEDIEYLWENGVIGSRECLTRQMALISAPLPEILDYVRTFSVNESFPDFVEFLMASHTPFGIISDGFQRFIACLLAKAGLSDAPDISSIPGIPGIPGIPDIPCAQSVPVYANRLIAAAGGLQIDFPYGSRRCSSGVCKCQTAEKLSSGLPVIHIGDGRSDFCIAEKAAYVFSKGKLTEHCALNLIPHTPFADFTVIERHLKMFLENKSPHRTQFNAAHVPELV
jgi:2-hydroxy-3-keto-5-methylthiopentenyl-1-phosphate phosphatase